MKTLEALPADVGELVRIVQGLCVYDVVAQDFYGVKLPAKRQGEIHLRSVEAMLERIRALDDRPLAELTAFPDRKFSELKGVYETDARLCVPPTVFNSLLNRPEVLDECQQRSRLQEQARAST